MARRRGLNHRIGLLLDSRGGACELHEDLMGYLSGFIGFFLVGLCKGLVIVVPLSLRDQGERCLWFA